MNDFYIFYGFALVGKSSFCGSWRIHEILEKAHAKVFYTILCNSDEFLCVTHPGLFLIYSFLCRRADQLMQEGNDDVIPFCIATGEVKKLVNFFTSRGQLKEAVLVAQVQDTMFFEPILGSLCRV